MPRVSWMLAASGLVLSGCAPARFEKATTSFSSSVTTLSTAMDTSLIGLAREETALREQRLISQGVVPQLSVACLEAEVTGPKGERLPACGLVASRGRVPELSPVWRQKTEALRILDALAVYAKGLQDLTSAETRKQTDEAVDSIALGIGGALTLAGQPEMAPLAVAAVKLGGFAWAEAQDARRYRHLQKSVEVGQSALVVVGPVLGDAFGAVNDARRGIGVETGTLLIRAVHPGTREYAAAFARVSAQAAQVEALQRADPAQAVTEMIKAHAALAQALKDNKGETVAVAQAMAELANRVTAVRTAIEAAKKGG